MVMKTTTSRLEKLFDDKKSELCTRLKSVQKVSLTRERELERVFSIAGLIGNRLRTCLYPEHVKMLNGLNKNMK